MLRPYQEKIVDEVYALWAAGLRAIIAQLPTGGGKTHMAAEGFIARETGRVLFLADLSTLLSDTHARLLALGIDSAIIAPWAEPDPSARVQVASVDTLYLRGSAGDFGLVILDECHCSEAATVARVLSDYPRARLLGLSATPARADNRALGNTWEKIVNGPSIAELQAEGSLVPWDIKVPGGGKGDVVNELLFRKWSRALVFSGTVKRAKEVAKELPRAEVMLGTTPEPERQAMRARYRTGETLALVGCGVFIQGFDEPATDCVALDAPFGSLVQYLQACGRGARPSPGKSSCLVLDCHGAALVHGRPDEPRTWTLDGTGSTTTSTTPLPPMAFCGKCWATFRKEPVCPRCGTPVAEENVQPESSAYRKWKRLVDFQMVDPKVMWNAYFRKMLYVARFRMFMKDQARAERWAYEKTEGAKGPRPDGSGPLPTT